MAFTSNNPSSVSIPGDPLQPAPALGILGHVAIHALIGAVNGLAAQQAARSAPDKAVARAVPAAPVEPDKPDEPDEPDATVTSAQAEQPVPSPLGHSQPMARRTLAMAQIQHHALQNLKLAHDITQAKQHNPEALPVLETQARNVQIAAAQNAEALGLEKIISGLNSYREATQLGLAKKLARGQIFPVPNVDGSVDVYELPSDALYAPTTKSMEIRKPIGFDPNGAIKWDVVGMVPPGGMTQAEALTQVVLPEQRAAAQLIRSTMLAEH